MNSVQKGVLLTALVLACGMTLLCQSPSKLGPADRPVFMSAARLALLCEDWGALHPGGQSPKATDALSVSTEEMVRSMGCEAYINGVLDQGLEKVGSHYHPLPSTLDFMKTLIDTFLKYEKEHPEEREFAASTILARVQRTIIEAQGGRSK